MGKTSVGQTAAAAAIVKQCSNGPGYWLKAVEEAETRLKLCSAFLQRQVVGFEVGGFEELFAKLSSRTEVAVEHIVAAHVVVVSRACLR
jgi:hypothetical protein